MNSRGNRPFERTEGDQLRRLSHNLERAEVGGFRSNQLHQLTHDTGIYGPGYEERRTERLKEKYGIEVIKS